MDETQKQLAEQKELLEKIYASVEKTRRAFMWTLIISVAVIVLPLIGMMLIVPQFLSSYSGLIP